MISERHPVSILVVSSAAKSRDFFSDTFSAASSDEIFFAQNAGEARRFLSREAVDIVLINAPLPDDSGPHLAMDIAQDAETGVILLVKNELYEQAAYQVEDYGIYTVSKPTSRQIIIQTARLVAATRMRLRKYEKKTASLQAKMEEIRIVNHAKWVLIRNLGLSEDSAHKTIEKQAMNTRSSKREVAEQIIKTYQN